MERPRAQVREIDGQLVLDDPDAAAMINAVNKHNCKATFEANAERVAHFVGRAAALPGASLLMVILNVDDLFGGELAAVFMPGQEMRWQAYRDLGLKPMARGLVLRKGIQELLDDVDSPAARKLRAITDCLPVVVMDFGAIEVFRSDGKAWT